jgi:hypothetical protein
VENSHSEQNAAIRVGSQQTRLTRYEESDKANCLEGTSITNNIFFPTKLSNSTGCGPELIAYKSNYIQIITLIKNENPCIRTHVQINHYLRLSNEEST